MLFMLSWPDLYIASVLGFFVAFLSTVGFIIPLAPDYLKLVKLDETFAACRCAPVFDRVVSRIVGGAVGSALGMFMLTLLSGMLISIPIAITRSTELIMIADQKNSLSRSFTRVDHTLNVLRMVLFFGNAVVFVVSQSRSFSPLMGA